MSLQEIELKWENVHEVRAGHFFCKFKQLKSLQASHVMRIYAVI